MLNINQHLTSLETLALEIGAASVKIMVTETQTFFISQFDHLQFSELNSDSASDEVKPNGSSATIEGKLETADPERSEAPPECSVGGIYSSLVDSDADLEIAYLLIPKLDAIRFNLIQAQSILSRIESQATMYQPGIRRLCGEATYFLAENINAVRATIEEAQHHRPQQQGHDMPTWW